MASQIEIRQRITDQIIEALKSGSLPSLATAVVIESEFGLSTNAATGRRYGGVNPMLLEIAAQQHGFKSKWWGTFKQWASLGGKVMQRPATVQPGQWGTVIVFWKPVEKVEIDSDTGEEETKTFGFLKQYHVFNIDQVEGECLDHLRVTDTVVDDQFIDYEPAEKVIAATEADIRFGGDRAFYRPFVALGDGNHDGDYIQLPPKHQFAAPKEFYATVFHELMHWSESRLGWKQDYALGELRAEIGACYSLAELQIPQSDDLTNHHAYLANWLDSLQRDPRYIFVASSAASKAVDFVLTCGQVPNPLTESAPVLVE